MLKTAMLAHTATTSVKTRSLLNQLPTRVLLSMVLLRYGAYSCRHHAALPIR
jgi:hypothetical protein